MAEERIEYHFISLDSPYYQLAVTLRHDAFYHSSGINVDQLVDSKEGTSTHLAAIHNDEVIGYIRITLEGKTAKLSQFVVAPRMQGKANVARDLYTKAMIKAKELGAKKVSGEIRLPMTGIASRLGYKISQSTDSPDDTAEHYIEKEI